YLSILLLSLFVSSRGRHTRFSRDWSSDVCSSDLARLMLADINADGLRETVKQLSTSRNVRADAIDCIAYDATDDASCQAMVAARSEERRVGKGCRSRGPDEPRENNSE